MECKHKILGYDHPNKKFKCEECGQLFTNDELVTRFVEMLKKKEEIKHGNKIW